MEETLTIEDIIVDNEKRNDIIDSVFDPMTGEGSIGERFCFHLSDFVIPVQYLPATMKKIPLIKLLIKSGSIRKFIKDELKVRYTLKEKDKVVDQFTRLRFEHDFPFWAYVNVMISCKGGGDDIHFRLNRQQRRLISLYEKQRLAHKPIRVVLAKSRQWGGSTATQIYMSWIQLVLKTGTNSLIVGHQNQSSTEVANMYEKMIESYPVRLLYPIGTDFNPNEKKYIGVGASQLIHMVPQRGCKIKLGSAETPNSARGGDSPLVHLTEVAFFKATDGKKPEDIVRAACAGAQPNNPMSMIVYESSPNGSGNFFQREYDAAKNGRTIFESIFVAWWENEQLVIPFESEDKKADFAVWLYKNRNGKNPPDDRHESGRYLWYLWTLGATLEAIQWYILQRSTYHDHADMAAEYPSDDEEAFTYSGARVFDKFLVNKFRAACKIPKFIGEMQADSDDGKGALEHLHFIEDSQGQFWIWEKPEISHTEKITDRYLVVVDIGGRNSKADWSVIVVIDRSWMIYGEKPVVVAQWYGHIDMDLLAWKAAQIAKYYDNALLVVESNTLETKDKERYVDGDQSYTVLNEIKPYYENLYARKQNEDEIREGLPVKYGFHTNVATKPKIISVLVKVVREHLYIERDERCLDEFLSYERKKNGAFGAIDGKHDDLLMTRAIAMQICFYEMELPKIIAMIIKPSALKRSSKGAADL